MTASPQPITEACWCCDTFDAPDLMVHLGNHPEVALCRGCARWAAKQSWAIDDRSKRGPLVMLRTGLRRIRQLVIDRGWHRNRAVGPALRWLGDRMP